MKDRVLVAITGGIGSGKTTVSKIIEECGFKVFSCDEIYKEISKTDNYLNDLKRIFPFAVEKNGELNREELAKVVFDSPINLKRLNDLAHPIILFELNKRIEKEKGIIFCEVPLLFEGNLQEKFDYVLIVLRELPLRIESIIKRDCTTSEKVLKRVENQFNYDTIKSPPSNYFLIENNEGIEKLKEEINNLIKILTVKHKL